MLSLLQKGQLQANKQIFNILPSFCLTFPDRQNKEVYGFMNSQATNFEREEGGYTNVEEREFFTDSSRLTFTPELNETVLIEGEKYTIKQITKQLPNIKLHLIKDIHI